MNKITFIIVFLKILLIATSYETTTQEATTNKEPIDSNNGCNVYRPSNLEKLLLDRVNKMKGLKLKKLIKLIHAYHTYITIIHFSLNKIPM
jgi:hypothetical protein